MERPQKSVLKAYLYLFLLGYLGGHRYYMKKPSVGLFMALLFFAGLGCVAAGIVREQQDLKYVGYGLGILLVTMMVVDLVMIPGMIEDLNNPAEDRRLSVIAGNLDPTFQATLRHAGRGDELEKPRKSGLPDDYVRPWKKDKRDDDENVYRPGEE